MIVETIIRQHNLSDEAPYSETVTFPVYFPDDEDVDGIELFDADALDHVAYILA